MQVGAGGISGVEGLDGRNAGEAERFTEDGRVGLSGTSGGGSDDGIEGEPVAFENAVEAEIEIRDDGREKSGIADKLEDFPDFGKNGPCRRIGIVGEEGFEAGAKAITARRFAAGAGQGEMDHPPPPFTLGGVTVGVSSPFRIAHAGEDFVKCTADRGGFEREPGGRGDASVDVGDGFGRLDQGAGGVEEEGADHAGRV